MTTDSSQRAVLFDLDGTLLDTTYFHTVSWWLALNDADEHRSMSAIHRLIGMGGTELLTALLGRDAPDISASHGKYFSEFHPDIQPLPGAVDLLVRVRQMGGVVAVVTSAKKRDLPALIGALGVGDLIDLTISGEDADRAKPHPDLFAIALNRLGLPPASTLAIGDAVWDVKAAGRANVECVGVLTGGMCSDELQSAGALAVYESCQALLDQWRESPMEWLLSN